MLWKIKIIVKKEKQGFFQCSCLVSSVVFLFRNEEDLVALLAYSSGKRVATNKLRRVSVATSSRTQVMQAGLI